MTTTEKLELLPEFLALADVVGDPLAENSSKSAEHREVKQKKRRILRHTAGEMCAPDACT
jgi:hypothetical protein